jgi:hypothetical protein
MTAPDSDPAADDLDQAAGDAGALAAASKNDDPEGDPLGPLNRITEDDS